MRKTLNVCSFTLLFIGCRKDSNSFTPIDCDIQQVYVSNAKKITIPQGVWGTVSFAEGDYMPTISYHAPSIQHCPAERTVKIYQYSTVNDAVPGNPYGNFFDSLNTQLVTQVHTDENGFFQADIPAGHYSIFVVENGKLYANKKHEQDGLSPFHFTYHTINVNLVMTYRVTY
ncbi:MAG: hypothetical protein KF862_18845 [Chitinophagaceae bacterium]|nr:hypothetical protein [Chitinophagaceae bacterium]